MDKIKDILIEGVDMNFNENKITKAKAVVEEDGTVHVYSIKVEDGLFEKEEDKKLCPYQLQSELALFFKDKGYNVKNIKILVENEEKRVYFGGCVE